MIAALGVGSAAGAESHPATPAETDETRHDAVVVSFGVEAPSAPFVAGDRVVYLEDGELLVWVDPTSPRDLETLEVANAVTEPVATTDAVLVPNLFAVSEVALGDGTESALYELEGDSISRVSSLAASDDAVAVGADDRLAVYDRGSGTPRWSISTGGSEVTRLAVTPSAVIAEVFTGNAFQVSAVAIESGEALWANEGVELDSVVALDESSLAIASTAGDEHRLESVDAVTGTLGWTQTSIPRFNSIALVNDTLVVTDRGAGVRFMDPADGTTIADADLGAPARLHAQVHPTLGAVIVDEIGTVHAFDPTTGEPTIAPFAIGEAPASDEPSGLGPAIDVHGFVLAGDMLYVTLDGAGRNSRLVGVDLTRLAP